MIDAAAQRNIIRFLLQNTKYRTISNDDNSIDFIHQIICKFVEVIEFYHYSAAGGLEHATTSKQPETTSPHKPRLVVPQSTCPPLSPSPHANIFVIRPAVINNITTPVRRSCPMITASLKALSAAVTPVDAGDRIIQINLEVL
jgi:hypothetical protein